MKVLCYLPKKTDFYRTQHQSKFGRPGRVTTPKRVVEHLEREEVTYTGKDVDEENRGSGLVDDRGYRVSVKEEGSGPRKGFDVTVGSPTDLISYSEEL